MKLCKFELKFGNSLLLFKPILETRIFCVNLENSKLSAFRILKIMRYFNTLKIIKDIWNRIDEEMKMGLRGEPDPSRSLFIS